MMRKPFIFKYLILVFLVLVGVITKTKNPTTLPKGTDSLHSPYVSHVLQSGTKSANLK